MSIYNCIKAFVFAVALAMVTPVFGQDLPDKPEPQTQMQQTQSQGSTSACLCKPHLVDREFVAEASGLVVAFAFDTISTKVLFDHHPEFHEIGPLFTGSRSTPKIMAAWGGVDVAAVVVSYEWKRHVKNRYLRPLWRLPLLYRAEGHSAATIHNMQVD